jgi:hypothetical protein
MDYDDILLRMGYFGRPSKHLGYAASFLIRNPGLAYCDDCLRNALSITRANFTERDAAFVATENGFVRAAARCSVCGVERRTSKRLPE